MISDYKTNFGIKVQAANAADAGVLGSVNVLDAGELMKLFTGKGGGCFLFYRFATTYVASYSLDLLGDTTAATLATGGSATEIIASSGIQLTDEDGDALVDDDTVQFVRGLIPIPQQQAAMRYYGLWMKTVTGTDSTVVAGDAMIVRDGQTNMPNPRASIPA